MRPHAREWIRTQLSQPAGVFQQEPTLGQRLQNGDGQMARLRRHRATQPRPPSAPGTTCRCGRPSPVADAVERARLVGVQGGEHRIKVGVLAAGLGDQHKVLRSAADEARAATSARDLAAGDPPVGGAYVGAHWPLEVVAGLALGALLASLIVASLRRTIAAAVQRPNARRCVPSSRFLTPPTPLRRQIPRHGMLADGFRPDRWAPDPIERAAGGVVGRPNGTPGRGQWRMSGDFGPGSGSSPSRACCREAVAPCRAGGCCVVCDRLVFGPHGMRLVTGEPKCLEPNR
jgi:hypothetical protein